MEGYLRCSWRGRDIGVLIIVFHVGIVTLRAEVHEVGDVQVILVVFGVVILVILHEVHIAIRPYADERVERLGRPDALVAEEEVVVARRRPEDAGKHDVSSECVVEDLNLAVRASRLDDRVSRAVIGSTTCATVVAIHRDPRNHCWTRPVERDGPRGVARDSDGFGAVVVNEDAPRRRDLAANRS